MARTQAQLVRIVLQDVLAKVHPQDSIPAADNTQVKNAYTDILGELRDQGLAYWPSNEIPSGAVRHVANIVAYEVAQAFGVPRSTLLDPKTGDNYRMMGEKGLRKHIAKRPTGEPIRAQYE